MKSQKTYTIFGLFLTAFLLCGCAQTDEYIDVNYWRAKIKTSVSEESVTENKENTTQDIADNGGDATEYLYEILGSDAQKSNDFFSNLGLSLANQLKQWGKEGTKDNEMENPMPPQTEVSVFQTTILEDASKTGNGRIQVILDRVVDGDTLIVLYQDMLLRVRLIGIDTPESVHNDETKNTPEGVEASNYMKDLLEDTEFLYLEFDQVPEDDYGRTLAYAWFNNEGSNIETDLLNGVILKSGHGTLMTMEPNTKYANELANIN